MYVLRKKRSPAVFWERNVDMLIFEEETWSYSFLYGKETIQIILQLRFD